jgi:hypothetical protein
LLQIEVLVIVDCAIIELTVKIGTCEYRSELIRNNGKYIPLALIERGKASYALFGKLMPL